MVMIRPFIDDIINCNNAVKKFTAAGLLGNLIIAG